MQKVTIILYAAVTFMMNTSFMAADKDKVKWLTIAEMQDAYRKAPRPVIIDVYTSWCGWCKVMDKETYRKDKVADYINEHYYAVKLDAEGKESIEWNGKTYGYNAENKSSDFASYLLYGR